MDPNQPPEESSEPTSASNPSSEPDASGNATESSSTSPPTPDATDTPTEGDGGLVIVDEAPALTEEALDELVKDDEVGVVDEGASAYVNEEGPIEGHPGVDADIPHEVRDVDVTCFKCGQKTGTSVTYKQFAEQQAGDATVQPQFKTRCNKCNHHSTYVLTETGTHTIA